MPREGKWGSGAAIAATGVEVMTTVAGTTALLVGLALDAAERRRARHSERVLRPASAEDLRPATGVDLTNSAARDH